MLINQSNFDNWLAGGVNSFSGTINFDYDLAYQDEKWVWTTTLDFALGYAKTDRNDALNKTEDQLEINSILQRKTKRKWSLSSSFNLKTQNAPGIQLVEQAGSISRVKTSAFFSPAYLRLGVGMAYKKAETIAIQFNPIAARLILVDRSFTQNLAQEETFFGVAADKTARWEAGASFAFQSKLNIAKNIFLATNFSLISNYFAEVKNLDFDFTSSLDMKVNDYLSAMLEIQLLYDDNALADLQFRQVFGLAISLPF